MIPMYAIPVAEAVPFESNRTNSPWYAPGSTGIVSTDVQSAIEEVKKKLEDFSVGNERFAISCGFDGTASSGRYLEFNSNVDSNLTGFVFPRAVVLHELAFGIVNNNSVTFTVYTWSGTAETVIATISSVSARKAAVTGLSVPLSALSEVRVKCTAGSGSRPVFNLWFRMGI